MATRPKDKGTRQETKFCQTANDWAGESVAERVALHGAHDQGDIRLRVDDLTVCVESKYQKSYPTESEIAEFKEQTMAEWLAADTDCAVLLVNLPRRGFLRAEVWMLRSTLNLLWGGEREDVTGSSTGLEHDWVRQTLLDFLWMCYGAPAWEDRRRA